MSPTGPSHRARRVDIEHAAVTDKYAGAGYASAFEVAVDDPGARSPEQWVRAVFEGPSRPLRWFVLFGWKAVLGLRLGPRASPGHVLGWEIVHSTDESIELRVESALMTAHKLLLRKDPGLVLATFIYFKRRPGRLLWSMVAPVHHVTEPYFLARAAADSVISQP